MMSKYFSCLNLTMKTCSITQHPHNQNEKGFVRGKFLFLKNKVVIKMLCQHCINCEDLKKLLI